MTTRKRYDALSSGRSEFLNVAVRCSKLTLPYLIREDQGLTKEKLIQPWQSVGSKAVTTLSSKLMLALLPPQTTFFKLQVRDDKLGEELPADIKSEAILDFAKIERMVMQSIAASTDRVTIHQAIKHLIVGGNALLFMDKDRIKHYPLNRYVVDRDGNGNVIEIVTKELINKKLLPGSIVQQLGSKLNNVSNDKGGINGEDVEIFTHCRRENNRMVWHQEVFDMIIPGSQGKAPLTANPWLVLKRFAAVDGENYGRGRE